jgi:hypothetical protein
MDKDRLDRFTSGDDEFQVYNLEDLIKKKKPEPKPEVKPVTAAIHHDVSKITDFSINQKIDDEL